MIGKNKLLKVFTFTGMLLLIGLGYAYLNASLKFEGTTHIGQGSWNLYLSNTNITSVGATTTFPSNSNSNKPVITNGIGTHQLDYAVIFNSTDDYYEYTFDAVNVGGVDADSNRESIKIKIDNGEFISLPEYFDINTEFLTSSRVNHGTTGTTKVKISLKSNITPEQFNNIQGKVISVREIFKYSVYITSN